MSDAMRKDFGDKAQEKITPDSSKSTVEKTKESVTGTLDKGARESTTDSQKSTTQAAADHVTSSKDETVHGGTGPSIKDKVTGMFSSTK